ncbi:MAG: tetratricopeptide repeat protein, partial [Crocinitomicaceae bacterium]
AIFNKETIIKSSSDVACECIGKISTSKKEKDKIKEVSKCINDQVSSYQLMAKILDTKLLEGKIKADSGKMEINISLNPDENSQEYKKYYYELERYIMANCPAVKSKMSANDKMSNKSGSSNKVAYNYYLKGLDESDKENNEKALGFYKLAVQEDPNFAFAWDNLGLTYRKLGNYDKAIDAYERSLEIDPKGVIPLQNLAVTLRYKGEYEKAIEAYQRLAKLDENNPEVYYGIGIIYASNLENFEDGLRNLCKAYNLYIAQKSPYRTDAEKFINIIHSKMKEAGKEDLFRQILKENNISEEK